MLEYAEKKPTLDKAIKLMKMCSKFLDIVVAKMSPICFVLPKAIATYFVYFVTDLGDDAFELTMPMW